MKAAIKAEFRKMLTVRSTYVIAGLSFALAIFLSFYIKGLKAAGPITSAGELAEVSMIVVSILSGLLAIAGTLLVTHEYRNNTINYTLTAARSRTDVLLAKIAVISVFALALNVLAAVLAPALTVLGWSLQDVSFVHQHIDVWSLLWRVAFVGWAYAMLALVIAFIARNMVASIVALFLIPSTVEQLLGLLLKSKMAYLPFTALSGVLQTGQLSHATSALVVFIYIVVGFLVSWQLFWRRDAS